MHSKSDGTKLLLVLQLEKQAAQIDKNNLGHQPVVHLIQA